MELESVAISNVGTMLLEQCWNNANNAMLSYNNLYSSRKTGVFRLHLHIKQGFDRNTIEKSE